MIENTDIVEYIIHFLDKYIDYRVNVEHDAKFTTTNILESYHHRLE
jgi:hypothetical protein